MRNYLPMLLLLLSTCSRSPKGDPLEMHLVQTSFHTHNPGVPPVINPGALVVTITSGKATGRLLHIAQGKTVPLQTFELDASQHTLICSTPVVDEPPAEEGVDVSFVQEADAGFKCKSAEVKLGKVARIARADGGQTLLEKANVLYRIQRTNLTQDRWRYPHEASLKTMMETSKNLDCEYIVLDVSSLR